MITEQERLAAEYSLLDLVIWLHGQPAHRPINMLTTRTREDQHDCGCIMLEFCKDQYPEADLGMGTDTGFKDSKPVLYLGNTINYLWFDLDSKTCGQALEHLRKECQNRLDNHQAVYGAGHIPTPHQPAYDPYMVLSTLADLDKEAN